MTWVWLALAIACEIVATLSLRASDGLQNRRWIAPVAAGYSAAFVFLALALSAGLAVGVAYGLWTAIAIAIIPFAASRIWGDPFTPRMVVGIALVMVGVLLVKTA